MKPERWRRIQLLFDRAVDLDEISRGRYLDEACRADPSLRDEVDALLRAEEAAAQSQFLDRAVRSAAVDFTQKEIRPGDRFDEYRLVRQLGSGGMGEVWLAERADGEYSALTAIKLVRGGFASPEVERRFRVERQILADLAHPNIARLIDGGTADDGMPYIVMEYVDGTPLTEWAASHDLDLESRLRLFRTICDAVQHAHRSLIVHRDLKPSNILVGPTGVPKLVDFGIAKMLAPGPGALQTVSMVRPMTPWYASPEQITGDRITVATDVYSLGVLLYELLTGGHPFGGGRATFLEVRRRILEEAPPPPSTAAAANPDRPRQVRPASLRGDLDAIVLRAMNRQAELRYATAAELDEDLRRFLEREPILARKDSLQYRAAWFAGRYAALLGAAAALIIVLATLATVYTVRLTAQRDEARASAQQIDDALGLMALALQNGPAPSETPEAAIANASRFVTAALALHNRNRDAEAEIVARAALISLEPFVDSNHPAAAHANAALGVILAGLGQNTRADSLLSSAFRTLAASPANHLQQAREAGEWLATFYETAGRNDDAALTRSRISDLSN